MSVWSRGALCSLSEWLLVRSRRNDRYIHRTWLCMDVNCLFRLRASFGEEILSGGITKHSGGGGKNQQGQRVPCILANHLAEIHFWATSFLNTSYTISAEINYCVKEIGEQRLVEWWQNADNWFTTQAPAPHERVTNHLSIQISFGKYNRHLKSSFLNTEGLSGIIRWLVDFIETLAKTTKLA